MTWSSAPRRRGRRSSACCTAFCSAARPGLSARRPFTSRRARRSSPRARDDDARLSASSPRARSRRAQHFHLSFARCSNHSIARAVDSAVDSLMATLTPAGPELLKVRARARACAPSRATAERARRRIHAPTPHTPRRVVASSARAQGVVTLSFFERRISRTLFGLVSNEEKASASLPPAERESSASPPAFA